MLLQLRSQVEGRHVCSTISMSWSIRETRGEDMADRMGSIISFFGTVAISASLAEIASIYPTAGGLSIPQLDGPRCHDQCKQEPLLTLIRSIPLGSCAGTKTSNACCVLVHWLDLHRRSDRSHGICSVRSWTAAPGPDYSEQRQLHPSALARNAVLLDDNPVFGCGEHLGIQSPSTYKFSIWFVFLESRSSGNHADTLQAYFTLWDSLQLWRC